MARLAASGELSEDDIYETGYRWSPFLRAWIVQPELKGQKFTPNGRYMGLDGEWKGEDARPMVMGAKRVMDNWTEGVTFELYTDAFRNELDSRIASGEIKLKNETDREELVRGAERFYELFVGRTYELSEGRRFYIVPDDEARTKRNRNNASAWAERAFHFISASMKGPDGQKVTVDGTENGVPIRQYSSSRADNLDGIIKAVRSEQCEVQPNGRLKFYGASTDEKGHQHKANVICEVIAEIDELGNIRGADLKAVTYLASNKNQTEKKKSTD